MKRATAWRAALAAALIACSTAAAAQAAGDPPQRPATPPYGLRVAAADEARLRELQVPFALEVTYVIGLAYNCGLRLGDAIVAVNGQGFDDQTAFWRLLDEQAPAIRLGLRRGSSAQTLPLDPAAPECAGR